MVLAKSPCIEVFIVNTNLCQSRVMWYLRYILHACGVLFSDLFCLYFIVQRTESNIFAEILFLCSLPIDLVSFNDLLNWPRGIRLLLFKVTKRIMYMIISIFEAIIPNLNSTE